MKKFLILFIVLIITSSAVARKNINDVLGAFAWDKRQLIVFTPDSEHQQYKLFKKKTIELQTELEERNLQSWHVIADSKVLLNTTVRDDVNNQEFRDQYAVKNNEFRLILIGYDQGEKLRLEKVNLNTVFSTIDKMPMRIQELQQ